MHPFIKNVRTSSIRVIVTISLYIALVLCAVGLIGVGTAPASGVNLSVDFNSNVTSGPAPLIVEFTGISDNATKWDLGDGNVSDVKDPSHTYFAPGVYNVTLTVSGMNETVTESKENYILVYQPVMPEADFSAAPSSGYAPLNVAFTDLSSNASSWDWDFGDGNTSTEQHPVHTYNSAGTYTVTLTVVNENGTSTESKTNLITVLQVPTYSVFSEVFGGAANITIDRPLAEEGQTVNVTISAIQTGKQFASISVTGESNQVNATEVIPGVSYTFTMPAENVTVNVTLENSTILVTSITVEGENSANTVKVGKTLKMIASVSPDDATNKNVTWSVESGTGTATITEDGWLTGTGAGTVIVKATAKDGSGVQDTIEITVTEAQSTTTASSGGGSQNTGEKNENIELKDYSIKYVLKDTETLFEFTKEGNSILSLGYTASLNGGQTKTIIEMLKGTSTLVSKAAPGIVYKNMNIWVGDGKAPAMLSDARIVFRVEKTWLSENRIDPASIRMFRYSGGSWNQLPTSMTGEDDTYVYYLARTPGFSAFAISGINEAQQAASTGAQQELSLSNEESAQMSTADSKTSEVSDAVSQEAQSAGSFTLLLVIAAITALGVLSYRHRDYLSQVRMQLGNPDGKRYRRIRK
ncbi:MAG: hypothetical protein PWP63_1824 [Methanolobus sp.]|nr:hypothetical protein [Methanolobus sp.]